MADDLLSPLGDGPVPPLAPAAVVRARGEQRRHRRRTALAGTAALALVLAGVTGAALAGPGGDDELRPVPFASEALPQDPLWEALLDPEDVQEVLRGAWEVQRGHESSFSYELSGCPETPSAIYPSAGRFLTDGDVVVGQHLSLHPDVPAAEDRFQQLVAMVRACAGAGRGYRLLGEGGDTATRVYGEAVDGDAVRPFVLQLVGRTVVTIVQDGAPEPSPELADAAADEVRAELGDDTTTEPSPPAPAPPAPSAEPAVRDWFLPDAFLPPELAADAEFPGWTVRESHTPDPFTSVADPCPDGTLPLDDSIRDQGEQVMGSEREAGGSGMLQEVYRYSSTTTAAQAFAEYEQRYARCSSVQDPNDQPGQTIRSEVVDRTDSRVVVRRIPCSPEGGCTEHFSTYVFLVRIAEAVTTVAYSIGEDGDPAEEARALAAAVERRLRDVVTG